MSLRASPVLCMHGLLWTKTGCNSLSPLPLWPHLVLSSFASSSIQVNLSLVKTSLSTFHLSSLGSCVGLLHTYVLKRVKRCYVWLGSLELIVCRIFFFKCCKRYSYLTLKVTQRQGYMRDTRQPQTTPGLFHSQKWNLVLSLSHLFLYDWLLAQVQQGCEPSLCLGRLSPIPFLYGYQPHRLSVCNIELTVSMSALTNPGHLCCAMFSLSQGYGCSKRHVSFLPLSKSHTFITTLSFLTLASRGLDQPFPFLFAAAKDHFLR